MKNLRNYIIGGLLLLLVAASASASYYQKKAKKQKEEIERLSNNYKVAQGENEKIRGENGLMATRLEAQQLTLQEMRTYYDNLVADVKDMKIQLRKVTGITAVNTETTNNINTVFRDSTRITDKLIESLDYSDRWIDLKIEKDGFKALINLVSRDSLVQVVHWKRKGENWLTRWATPKIYYQDIKSMNPNSRITYSKWITPLRK
jgi:hypothetical protein